MNTREIFNYLKTGKVTKAKEGITALLNAKLADRLEQEKVQVAAKIFSVNEEFNAQEALDKLLDSKNGEKLEEAIEEDDRKTVMKILDKEFKKEDANKVYELLYKK